MKVFGYVVGMASVLFLGVFITQTQSVRGEIYQDISAGWRLTYKEQFTPVSLPMTFDDLSGAKVGARASLLRNIRVPAKCKRMPCYVFFGEAGDLARIKIGNRVVKTQGYADGRLSISRHIPLWAEIPSDQTGDQWLELEIESLYGVGFGLQSGNPFIGDYMAVRQAERGLTMQSVTFPLMQCLLLAILGLLLLMVTRLWKQETAAFQFAIFCLAASAFSASFSMLPREYLSVTTASTLHFTLRLFMDWSLLECLNKLLPMRRLWVRILRFGFLVQFFFLLSLFFDDASYLSFVKVVRWSFPIIVGTPILGLISSIQNWRIKRKIPSSSQWENTVLTISMALLLICQIWDTAMFWNFVHGGYLVKFYLAPLAFIFAILFVHRYFRHYSTLLKAKAESEKDALLGRIAVEFSHDLKSPLNTLRDGARIALDINDQSYTRDVLSQVITKTTTVSNRLQELFRYAREDISEKSPQNLKKIVDEVAAEVLPSAKVKNLHIRLNIPHEYFSLDKDSFKRVLQNIIQNSIEASPQNSVIDISGSIVKNRLVISIKDSGVGIAEDELTKIFDPYFTKGKAQGTGLGLAIVDRIVRQHGGTIQVFSRVGQGSTFVLEIPQ